LVQKARTRDKRERILAAAVKVFAAKGFYCARVSEVAREAGVADGTIYLYFSSKEEILRGLFEENMRRLIDDLSSEIEKVSSNTDKMTRLVDSYCQFVHNEPQLTEVLTVELRESGKFMNEFAAPLFGEYLRVIVDILEAGQKAGEFGTHYSARTVARAIFGALDELALSWVMSKSKWDLRASGHELLGVFLHGICDPERVET
jgi:TetR/AcrR family fatty acid metabolism transcriptional regulator